MASSLRIIIPNHSKTHFFRLPGFLSAIVRYQRRLLFSNLLICLLLFPVSNTFAALSYDPSLTWDTLHSRHFAVHYHDGEEALARESVAIAEKVHARLSKLFNWTPSEPTDIILSDKTDFPNGFASPVPTNRMTLFVAAPDDLTLEDHAGFLETLITHEYTHILHLDKATGGPAAIRKIFGRLPLPFAFPNAFQPTWLIEGLATYTETDAERGIGRGQSSFFDMFMRMEVDNGVKPLRQINQPIASWPGGTAPYLYGVQFYNFIAETKGQEKILRMIDNYSEDLLPFAINTNSEKVFGKNLSQMWDEFEAYLKRKYDPQLAAIRQQGVREGERITHGGYFGGSARALADGTLFYIRNDGRSHPALMVWRTGKSAPKKLIDVHQDARFAVHPTAGILLTQIEFFHNTNYYYDLYRVNPESGAIKRLTKGARYRYATWSPYGTRIAAVHNALGVNSLQLLDAQGKISETLWTAPAGEVIAGLNWSPDGTSLVASVWRRTGGWNLEQFFLAQRNWKTLTNDAAIKMHPQFSTDGSSILFSSDHGGVYNIRRFELATGKMSTLTNVKGGAFQPAEGGGGVLYYTGYGPEGFDVYRLRLEEAGSPPFPTPGSRPGPSAVAAEPAPMPNDLATTPYSPWSGLQPHWWLPHIAIENHRSELGAVTAGWDPLLRHIYAADVAYDITNEGFVGALDYIYDRWYPVLKLHASRQNDFFRNTDAELQRIRHRDDYQLDTVFPFLYYDSNLALHMTVLQDRESDDKVAPGVPAVPDRKDNIAGVGLVYDSTHNYPLSISRSNGRHIALIAEDSSALAGGDFTGEIYTLDWREFLALGGEHVLGVRLVEGWGTDAPRPFSLGGSASASQVSVLQNIVNTATQTLFDQRDYPLRGFPTGLPALTGRRMFLSTLEWRFPMERIERGTMVPLPLGLHQVSGSVFVDSGGTWNEGSKPEKYSTGAGVEMNARAILFYALPLNLRLGYAHGFDAGGGNQVYLHVGASF